MNYFNVLRLNRGTFFMKKFLYLRVNALVATVISIVLFYNTMSADRGNTDTSLLLSVLGFLGIYGLPVLHNLLIIFIYRRFYPDKEVRRPHRWINTILSILCLIDLMIFIFFINMFSVNSFREDDKLEVFIIVTLLITLSITTVVQAVGSFRLIKIVRENVRMQLKDSFI